MNRTLNIDVGDFKGDVDEVKAQLQAYADKNKIEFSGFRGYGTLTVNGVKHNITPYGIDIPMMLEFFGFPNSTLSNRI
ncbi:hypothetical protein [Legionella santicrucis]|nr:hypothetical protein [Legionella santicrucis]